MAVQALPQPELSEEPGKRLVQARWLAGQWTRERLEEETARVGIRVPEHTIGRIENGRKASVVEMIALSLALNVTPAQLGFLAEDYPEVATLKDPKTLELIDAMGWSVKRRSHLRVVTTPTEV